MMWTIFLVTIAYVGIGVVFFLLGQISLQKKIERKTGVAYRNYTQSDLILEIEKWKQAWDNQRAWDIQRTSKREAFIHKGGGNDPEAAEEE